MFLPRLLGCLWPRAHFSDLTPRAPQRAQIHPTEGAAFERGSEVPLQPGVSFDGFRRISVSAAGGDLGTRAGREPRF